MNKQKLTDLTPGKRRQLLLETLEQEKVLDVREAAARLFTSEATIRRDFNKLAATGLVRRTYGGAVLVEGLAAEIPLQARENQHVEQKDSLCRQAAEMVCDGDTIFLDSSSTVCRMVRHLRNKRHLKIITNGAKTAVLLAELPEAEIYCTGGKLRENSLSYIGPTAIAALENFYTDLCFFSCRSLSERGLSDSNEEEAQLRRAMLRCSRCSVLLADGSKWGTDSSFYICGLAAVDRILSQEPACQK